MGAPYGCLEVKVTQSRMIEAVFGYPEPLDQYLEQNEYARFGVNVYEFTIPDIVLL